MTGRKAKRIADMNADELAELRAQFQRDEDATPKICENCEHIFDDSDGPEYGEAWWRCSKNASYENLKAFPFKKEMPCFELNFNLTASAAEHFQRQGEEMDAVLPDGGESDQ